MSTSIASRAISLALGLLATAAPLVAQDLEIMVEIPGGEFVYQEGQNIDLPTFYIHKFEVTVGQYAEFVEQLQANPTAQYDHPDQPEGLSHHLPPNWEVIFGIPDGFRQGA